MDSVHPRQSSFTSPIEQYCRQKHPQFSSLSPSPAADTASLRSSDLAFRPLLLFIPLRPGQDRIRDEYREGLKVSVC